jgi:hypothetical protein
MINAPTRSYVQNSYKIYIFYLVYYILNNLYTLLIVLSTDIYEFFKIFAIYYDQISLFTSFGS